MTCRDVCRRLPPCVIVAASARKKDLAQSSQVVGYIAIARGIARGLTRSISYGGLACRGSNASDVLAACRGLLTRAVPHVASCPVPLHPIRYQFRVRAIALYNATVMSAYSEWSATVEELCKVGKFYDATVPVGAPHCIACMDGARCSQRQAKALAGWQLVAGSKEKPIFNRCIGGVRSCLGINPLETQLAVQQNWVMYTTGCNYKEGCVHVCVLL